MNTEKLVEVIKNLNVKFDGSLNSETVEKVIATIAPYAKMYFIYQGIMTILGYATLILCVYFISQATMKFFKRDE